MGWVSFRLVHALLVGLRIMTCFVLRVCCRCACCDLRVVHIAVSRLVLYALARSSSYQVLLPCVVVAPVCLLALRALSVVSFRPSGLVWDGLTVYGQVLHCLLRYRARRRRLGVMCFTLYVVRFILAGWYRFTCMCVFCYLLMLSGPSRAVRPLAVALV